MEINLKIKELRDKKDFTQEDLAARSGFSLSTIKRWESGVTSPSIKDLSKLASVLGISMVSLIEGESSNNSSSETISASRDFSIDSKIGRLYVRNGDKIIDLPATSEGYKAFSEALAILANTTAPAVV